LHIEVACLAAELEVEIREGRDPFLGEKQL
jgi:hypothetical protein